MQRRRSGHRHGPAIGAGARAGPAGTWGGSHTPRESTPMVSTITKVPTIRHVRRAPEAWDLARGRAPRRGELGVAKFLWVSVETNPLCVTRAVRTHPAGSSALRFQDLVPPRRRPGCHPGFPQRFQWVESQRSSAATRAPALSPVPAHRSSHRSPRSGPALSAGPGPGDYQSGRARAGGAPPSVAESCAGPHARPAFPWPRRAGPRWRVHRAPALS